MSTAFTDSHFLIPSKTFLLGEYAALQQGPAILAATAPCFDITFNTEVRTHLHPDSAAARYVNELDYGFTFTDPHAGAGGFGASSAQFIAAYLARHEGEITSWELLLQAYQSHCLVTSGALPSGYDVLAQYAGKLALIGEETTWLESLDWPYEDLSFILARTGNKIPTHEHLEQLDLMDVSSLNEITEYAQNALLSGRRDEFLGAITQYAFELDAAKLTCEPTRAMLAALEDCPTILAAKGCGSLGADVIALFCNTKDKQDLIRLITSRGLHAVADETQLQAGVGS